MVKHSSIFRFLLVLFVELFWYAYCMYDYTVTTRCEKPYLCEKPNKAITPRHTMRHEGGTAAKLIPSTPYSPCARREPQTICL